MLDIPGPGIEPMSPALAGGFSTTAPPGKPLPFVILRESQGWAPVWHMVSTVIIIICSIIRFFWQFNCVPQSHKPLKKETLYFRVVLDSQKNFKNSTVPVYPIFNVPYRWHLTLVTCYICQNRWTKIDPLLSANSDFLSFHLMYFICPRIPSKTPHLVVMSLWAPPVCGSFLGFDYLDRFLFVCFWK